MPDLCSGEKDRQAETKVVKTVKSKTADSDKTTGEAGGAESKVHNT